MDTRDVAILAALHAAPRDTYGDVGARVGLSGNAVKARLARLHAEGALQGVAAEPDPALLGLSEGLLVFHGVDDAAEREDELLRGLPDVPGVRLVDVGLDRTVTLQVLHGDDADWERIERAAISIVGKPPTLAARALSAPSAALPPLSPLDWRVARAILPDGRMPLKDVASRAGTSQRTAKRRLDALLADGRLRVEPIASPSEWSGVVLADLLLLLRPGVALRELPLGDAVASRLPRSRLVRATHAVRTPREAHALLRQARAWPGVEHAMLLPSTRRRAWGFLEDAIAERLAPVPAPAAAPAPVPVPRTSW